MADQDNLFDKAMDAPTPMDDLTPMDEPTPADVPIEEDKQTGNKEPIMVPKPDAVDDKVWTFILSGRQYVNGKMLRKGEKGHADIFLVEEKNNGKKVILKLYQKGKKPKDISALETIQHITAIDKDLHLVPLLEYGWYKEPDTSAERFYEVQEYMEGGTLNGLPNNTSAETLFTIIKSVAKGLYQLNNACGISHGDLKMSNLFLTSGEDGRVLIGDYDCARFHGLESLGSVPYDIDRNELFEMFKRFDLLSNNKDFAKFLDIIASDYGNNLDDIAEWIGKYEYHNVEEGKKDVFSLPFKMIVYLAEQDALRYGCRGQKEFNIVLFQLLFKRIGCDDYVEWIEECFSSEKRGCAPYSNNIAAWKCVQNCMESDDHPVFEIGNVLISHPDDLKSKQIDRTVIIDSLRNGHLKDWLAIFFHQNPLKDFTQQFEYERAVDKYLAFISQFDPKDENVVRLDEARDEIRRGISGVKNWKWGIIFTQTICGLLFAIPALLFIGWMIFNGLPINGNPLTNSVGIGFLVIGCLVGGLLYTVIGRKDYEFSGCGCLIAGVVGAFLFALIFYLMVRYISFVLPALPWITILLMLGVGVFVFMTLFNKALNYSGLSIQKDPDTWIVQPLYYAFDTSQKGYDYRQEGIFDTLKEQYRDGLKKMVLKMVVPILFAWGMWLGYRAITPELGGKKVETLEDQINKMEGDWSGTFGENKATMQVLNTSRDSFQLSMTVMFKKPVTQTFTGKVEGLTELKLDNDTPDDGILDGSLEADYDPDKPDVVSGKYKNYTTEKIYHFHFKKQTTNNDSVQ